VRIWDAHIGLKSHELQHYDDPMNGVGFSRDSKLVVFDCRDETVCICDAQTRDEVHVLRGHNENVTSVMLKCVADL
jgi:WD40 repeat protein